MTMVPGMAVTKTVYSMTDRRRMVNQPTTAVPGTKIQGPKYKEYTYLVH